MGEHEEWQEPSGLLPNGLLPNVSASVVNRVLDKERWAVAEERTAELIVCIQPNEPSENRRNAVADYVQRLITKCFPCQVFTFGSVPLKTYLPDGDIDLTTFSKNQTLKDTWAVEVRDLLESEEKNENAEFRVKEVQYIQAEVKIIKCLVENIVVDISFNQLGGLCTLCFLEEVDNLINQNHLFKRSIILIKAWCYYESRILGAHHGLISTYALETLVLYIFHVFNNHFAGPLEVLYRFLEFFSNFDWENFCVSLWGPVPISSLPKVTAEPPRKDGGKLLLSEIFLSACSTVYAVFPVGQENQGLPFISKYFNVIDPLRENNNLGRSVSKGNFHRIRSAFTFGAKRLARLLDCPKENIVHELNQFFMNTWERHGSGIRPDAPESELWQLRPSDPDDQDPDDQLDYHKQNASSKKINENASAREFEVEGPQSFLPLSSQRASYPFQSTARVGDVPEVFLTQAQKNYSIANSSRSSDQTEKGHSSQNQLPDKSHRNWKPDNMVSEVQGKYLFARTRSSPELTDASCGASFKARRNKPAESGKTQVASLKPESYRRRNIVSEVVSAQSTVSSSDDPPSSRQSSSHHLLDSATDSNSVSNSYAEDSGTGTLSQDQASVMGAQGMLQDEQDLVNMMSSSSLHSFGGQVGMPLNLASGQLPFPFPQSVLASMGFTQRGMAGMVPGNFPIIDPHWAANMQFHQGLMPSPLTHYYPGPVVSTHSDDLRERNNENFNSSEMARRDLDSEYWGERDEASNGRFDDGSMVGHAEDRQPSTSSSSLSSLKAQQKNTRENRASLRDEFAETFHRQDTRYNEVCSDDRVSSARFSSASHTGSVRSKTSSESSWDGSSARVSKVSREKRGRKTVSSVAAPLNTHGKGKNVYGLGSADTTEADDDNKDEIEDKITGSHSVSNIHFARHHLPVIEGAKSSKSDPAIPVASMVTGPVTGQRGADNSGRVPIFYPAGPPVHFVTMLPFDYMSEAGASDPSRIHLGRVEGPNNSDSGQNLDSSEGHDVSDVLKTYNSLRRPTTELSDERRADILNSDFTSHWANLQFGRLCQNPRFPAPVICPSPVVVPPMFLQGRVLVDGPGRPVAANMNLLSQLTGYGPHVVPVSPLQSAPNRPAAAGYQQYGDELPKYRSGTGTYLPNPKPSVRDRQSSGTRRNSYHDRSDQADREGNWNYAKTRAAGRSHNRNQVEKPRIDRLAGNENRTERPWSNYRHEQLPSYQSQNGPLRPSSSHSSSGNVAYGMYPMASMNPSGVASNGPNAPSVMMFYSYDHHSGYVSPGEPLEFGSLGPVGYTNDAAQPADMSQVSRALEDQRFHRNSAQLSSPDQPSSPHFPGSVAQRKYQLKDEDFPPLVF